MAKFCRICGKELMKSENDDTGKKVVEWKCPDKRWYNSHAVFVTDKEGNDIADHCCVVCGSELIRKETDVKYDIDTGGKVFNILWICPNKMLYNGHTKFKTDEEGNKFIEKEYEYN